MGTETVMSDIEWNALIDRHVEELNKKRGTVVIPPPQHLLSENEYQFGINHRVVTEDLIRHFANAMGDPNPLWRDPDYARGTRWGGIIAPPIFEFCIANCDGAGVPSGGVFLLPGFNLFAAGNKHEYFGLIRPGDEFRIFDRYLGPEEKQIKDKSYRLFVDTGQRTYVNQRDEVVAVATGRRIMTGVPPSRANTGENKLYQGIKRHHFSQAELDVIHRHYDAELAGKNRRGAQVRYWEDVVEGEELPPVCKGPLDMTDACAGMILEYNYAFAVKWEVMRKTLDSFTINPETGEYRYRRDWHFDDELARSTGVPYAFQIGKYQETILAHVLTNWMGDDGLVKMVDIHLRRINIVGDMNWLKGRVVRKYFQDKEPLVDLEIWSENQDGVLITKAEATVRLVSRTV
jgi:acyl dehydratase